MESEILKSREHPEYTFVLGAVLVPESPDFQGDVAGADLIEKAAHDFLDNSGRPGLMHSQMMGQHDVSVVESYVTRDNCTIEGRDIPAGSWVIGMRVRNPVIRKSIRDGKLRGFSIGGRGKREPIVR